MKIAHKLFTAVLLTTLLYVGLFGLLHLTNNEQSKLNTAREHLISLEKSFLLARVQDQSFPNDTSLEPKVQQQIEVAQHELDHLLPYLSPELHPHADKLRLLLADYYASFTAYADDVASLSAQRTRLQAVTSVQLTDLLAADDQIRKLGLASTAGDSLLYRSSQMFAWLSRLLQLAESDAVSQANIPRHVADIEIATHRIQRAYEQFHTGLVSAGDPKLLRYSDNLKRLIGHVAGLSALVLNAREKIQGHQLDALGLERRILGVIGEMRDAAANIGHQRSRNLLRLQWIGVTAIILLGLGGGITTMRSITRPLQTLVRHVDQMARGDLSRRVERPGNDELGHLGHSFNYMAEQLESAFSGVKASNDAMAATNELLEASIRNLRETEEQLRNSEEKYSQLFETSSDAILLLDGERFSECNPATLRIFGYESRDEFCAVGPADVSPEYQPDGSPSGSSARARIRRTVETGSHQFEWLHKRKNGQLFPADVLLTAFEINGERVVQATVRDITLRKEAEQLLQKSNEELEHRVSQRTNELTSANQRLKDEIAERTRAEQQLRLSAKVFDNASEGIAIADAAGRVLDVNVAYSRITGYAKEEVVNSLLPLLDPGQSDQELCRRVGAALKGQGHWQGEVLDRRKSGALFPNWVSIVAIKGGTGQITNYVVISSDISELKQAQENLEQLAHYDNLTGLPNRNLMRDRLSHGSAFAERNGTKMAVMVFDLDRFKHINDSLGHDAGDRLLVEVTKRLASSVRASDTIARFGGDEFAVILNDIHSPEDAVHVAQEIINALSPPFVLQNREVFISASIGIALYPDDTREWKTLIQFADAAMYHAKEQGKNNYQFYSHSLNENAMNYLEMEFQLRKALEQREFQLFYQPQVDSRSGAIVGMEALIRWQRVNGQFVAPDKFIPIAEETGLIVPIGEWVLHAACSQAKHWCDQGITCVRVAVNLSGRQFRHHDIVQVIDNVLLSTGLPPTLLEVEITESILMEQQEEIIEAFRQLKAMGVSLAIDDFGTGYSSLSYLKRFPIDRLKVDRSFVRDVVSNPDDAAITTAVIALAKSLNLEVIAEGVENEEQRAFLSERGCNVMQGYYFGRPVPANEVAKALSP